MPKSAKKRKAKAADFSKAKLKLGKGKKAATNAIDTSFKARSIALPTQSIAVEKDDSAPTTKRRLTFEDLIAHLKHHNAGARKDAILGLRELIDGHRELLDSGLTILINTCVRIIGDEDASVRKVLLAFFTWLLPQIPHESLVPHSPLLLLFTTSAQTHIFPEIRVDAIRFLNLFLEYIPEAVVASWSEASGGHGSRILEGYLGILNAGTKFGGETDGPMKATSTASVVLTPGSKLIVLQSLSSFLQHALSSPRSTSLDPSVNPTSTSIPSWYLASSFETADAYNVFEQLLHPPSENASSSRCWSSQVDPETGDDEFIQNYKLSSTPYDSHWTLQQLSDVVNVNGGLAEADASHHVDVTFVAHLARTLHSTLISTFLDCAPTVFSPSGNPPEVEVKLIVAVAEITRSLYGVIMSGPESISTSGLDLAYEDLQAILGYMTPYFPFRLSGGRDIKLEQAFQDLNLNFCELTSLLVLASEIQSSNHTTRANRRGKAKAKARQPQNGVGGLQNTKSQSNLSIQITRVSEYVIQLLRGESAAAASSSSQLGRALTPAVYISLLPTIWSLINSSAVGRQELSSNVLQATVEHATKASSKSALKRLTTEFVALLVLLEAESQYHGNFRAGRNVAENGAFSDWINHLPQTLWELGSTAPPTTEIILRFLLRATQRKSSIITPETLTSLKSRLIPFFRVTHPARGQLPGPFTKLPPSPSPSSSLRRLALDVAATILSLASNSSGPGQHHGHGQGDDALEAAVDHAVGGSTSTAQEQAYWSHLKTATATR